MIFQRDYRHQAGLGRIHIPDEDDKKFLMPRARTLLRLPTSKHWLSLGEALDQGGTSECVLHAGEKYLTTHPVVNKGLREPPIPTGLTRHYKIVQTKDIWPGEDYDGTSVRALFKYLKELGYISDYRWAFDIQPVIAHLLTKGPVIFGTDWYMDMFTPDRWGYIWPTGEWAGGHSFLAIGVSLNRRNPDGTVGAIRFLNSWGPKWAEKGRFWMAIPSADKLVQDNGEAGVATEIKLAA